MVDPFDDLLKRAQQLESESSYTFMFEVIECSKILNVIDPRSRKRWLDSVVKELYLKQGAKCALCGESLQFNDWDVDHIIQFKYGGGNERDNAQLAHKGCNRAKGLGVDPSALLRYLEDQYMNLRSKA